MGAQQMSVSMGRRVDDVSDDEAPMGSRRHSVGSESGPVELSFEGRCNRAAFSAIDAWGAIDKQVSSSQISARQGRFEKRQNLNSLVRNLANTLQYSERDKEAVITSMEGRKRLESRITVAMSKIPKAEGSLMRVLTYHRGVISKGQAN
jgi:hypothetical protein